MKNILPLIMKHDIKLYRRLLAVWLILSVATLAGGSGDSYRVVRVTGERLHLRAFLPVTLDHNGVERHLRVGEEFTVEKVRYGLRYDGRGMGDVWFFVRSLRDPEEAGWVHSKWLEEIAGARMTEPVDERVTSTATAPATGPPQQNPATTESRGSAPAMSAPAVRRSPGVIVLPLPPPEPPWSGHVVNLLSIVASLMTMAAISLPWFRGNAGGPGTSPPSPAPIPRRTRRKSNFVYGAGFFITRR